MVPCRWVCWQTRWKLRERRFGIWTYVWRSTGRNSTPLRRCCNRCVCVSLCVHACILYIMQFRSHPVGKALHGCGLVSDFKLEDVSYFPLITWLCLLSAINIMLASVHVFLQLKALSPCIFVHHSTVNKTSHNALVTFGHVITFTHSAIKYIAPFIHKYWHKQPIFPVWCVLPIMRTCGRLWLRRKSESSTTRRVRF